MFIPFYISTLVILFMKQSWTNYLHLSFSLEWGIVVHRVEKSNYIVLGALTCRIYQNPNMIHTTTRVASVAVRPFWTADKNGLK